MNDEASQILQALPPEKQEEAKQIVQGLDLNDLLKDLDLGFLGKKAIKMGIELVRESVMPKIRSQNPTLAFVVESVLGALESQLGV